MQQRAGEELVHGLCSTILHHQDLQSSRMDTEERREAWCMLCVTHLDRLVKTVGVG